MSEIPERAACRYQAYWCEENAWHLAAALSAADPARPVWLVFVTNATRTCAMWSQRAAEPMEPVVWDYHVVVVTRGEPDRRPVVFDLDSRLKWGQPGAVWAAQTFAPPGRIDAQWVPVFRLLPAAVAAHEFASDRRHMRDATGEWQQPPPPWSAITPNRRGEAHTLDRLLDVADAGLGEWRSLDEFLSWLDQEI